MKNEHENGHLMIIIKKYFDRKAYNNETDTIYVKRCLNHPRSLHAKSWTRWWYHFLSIPSDTHENIHVFMYSLICVYAAFFVYVGIMC